MTRPDRLPGRRLTWSRQAADSGSNAGQDTSVPPSVPAGTSPPGVVTATCTGRTSDAASLQKAISSSSPGAVIEIKGTCLLTRGIIFLGDRTYTGYNTTGIAATVQGGRGSTIFNNKIFNDLGESPGAKYTYLCITKTNYGTGFLSVTGNVIVGDQSSDVGLAFDGGSSKLIVASSGNEVVHVGTVKSHTRSATVTAGT